MLAAPKATLNLQHFSHIKDDVKILGTLLKHTFKSKKAGCNFLIYGNPGTGKTQLAYALAESCKANPLIMSSEFSNGKIRDGEGRIKALTIADKLAKYNPRNLIIFDEMEDIIREIMGSNLGGAKKKLWFNQFLENNNTPIIWISNDIENLDAAFIRRFKYVLEVGNPPKKIKHSLFAEFCSPYNVDKKWLNYMSEQKHISPAIIENACSIAKISANSDQSFQHTVQKCIENSLQAIGSSIKPLGYTEEIQYRPDFCNTTIDIEKLSHALKKSHEGRICVYGPPGTGKTALAYHLSEIIGIGVTHKKASDLLGSFIGETEKAIANMFDIAKKQGTILLLDEADSFLSDRSKHSKSWETSMVNELLVQMESYHGIFIASSNLFDNMDSAVLRRFDFKLYFDYLTEEQNLELFAKQAKCSIKKLDKLKLTEKIRQLTFTTPGDYAAISRRLRIMGQECNPNSVFNALNEEVSFKKISNNRPIGFIH